MILNKVILAGRMASEPELRVTGKGTPVASASVAFNPAPYYGEGGQLIEPPAVFVNVFRFGKGAETMAKNFTKGTPVLIEGSLRSDEWDDKRLGIKRRTLKIEVITMQRSMVTNFNYCRVMISGNLTKDPELHKITRKGKPDLAVSTAAIAFNDFPYQVAGSREMRNPDPVFVDCSVFSDDAENLVKYQKSGNTLFLEGTLYTNTYTPKNTAEKVSQIRMKADPHGVRFIKRMPKAGSSSDTSGASDQTEAQPEERHAAPVAAGGRARPASTENLDEDVPF